MQHWFILTTKIRDVWRFFRDFKKMFGDFSETFLRISAKILIRFYGIFVEQAYTDSNSVPLVALWAISNHKQSNIIIGCLVTKMQMTNKIRRKTAHGNLFSALDCRWCNIMQYYSLKYFPRFWLVKTTRIIHHNQPLLTKNFVILNQWRQKSSPLQIIEPLTSKWRHNCNPLQIIEPLTSKIIEPLTEKT